MKVQKFKGRAKNNDNAENAENAEDTEDTEPRGEASKLALVQR